MENLSRARDEPAINFRCNRLAGLSVIRLFAMPNRRRPNERAEIQKSPTRAIQLTAVMLRNARRPLPRVLQPRPDHRGTRVAGQAAHPARRTKVARRPHRRGRSLSRRRRPCRTCLRWSHAPQRGALWPARTRIRVLHLRQLLLPQRLVHARRPGRGCLLRAMEPVFGLETMARARGVKLPPLQVFRSYALSPAARDACRKHWRLLVPATMERT